MEGKLPRYNITIGEGFSDEGEEQLGITQVAYVENPAILTKGVYLNDNKLAFADELKYRVAAPALIPNLPIYRFDEEIGEYEVIFTEETIEQLRQEFMLSKGPVTFNLDHDSSLESPSYILDSWITGEPENDPSFTQYGIKLPKGSWFVVSQFTDKDYFKEEIIDKDRAAYSIEGFLGLALSQIKQKLNKEKMEELLLPDGEHMIGDKVYVVENGIVIEIKDVEAPAEDVVEEELAAEEVIVEETLAEEEEEEEVIDEVIEEEAAEEVVEEEVAEEEVAEPSEEEVNQAILDVVQPKFDELYAVIAELKTMVEGGVVVEEELSNVKLSRIEQVQLTINKLKSL